MTFVINIKRSKAYPDCWHYSVARKHGTYVLESGYTRDPWFTHKRGGIRIDK